MKKLVILLAAIMANIAEANFMATPGTTNFESTGKNAINRIVVENLSNKEVVIENTLFNRIQVGNEDSGSVEKNPNKYFKIYPKIVKIPPKQKKAVIVKWVGPASVKETQAFYLKVAEKEIKKGKEKKGTRISVMIEYYLNLLVNPKDQIKTAEIVSSTYLKKENKFKLTVKNTGNVLFKTSESGVFLVKTKPDGSKETKSQFEKQELKGFLGKSILPGKTKDIFLTAPKGFEGDSTVVKFEE